MNGPTLENQSTDFAFHHYDDRGMPSLTIQQLLELQTVGDCQQFRQASSHYHEACPFEKEVRMKRKILLPILILGFELVCLTGEARYFGRRNVEPQTKSRSYQQRIEAATLGSNKKYLLSTLLAARPKAGAKTEVYILSKDHPPRKGRLQNEPEFFDRLEQEIRSGRPPYVWLRSSNDVTEGVLISSDATNGPESQFLLIHKEAIDHMADSSTIQELVLEDIAISFKLSDIKQVTVSTPGF